MIINPKILQLINQHNLDEDEAMLFCNLWWFRKYYTKAENLLFITLKDVSKVINLDNEEKYRVIFLKLEDGELVLKYPFFVKEQSNSFDLFVKKIADTRLTNLLRS